MVRDRRPSADRGATAVEYALIASLIAVVALVGIVYFGRSVAGSFEDSTAAIGAAVGGVTPSSTASSTETPSPTATPTDTPSPTASPSAARTLTSVSALTADTVTVIAPEPEFKNGKWVCPEPWQVTGKGNHHTCVETGRN